VGRVLETSGLFATTEEPARFQWHVCWDLLPRFLTHSFTQPCKVSPYLSKILIFWYPSTAPIPKGPLSLNPPEVSYPSTHPTRAVLRHFSKHSKMFFHTLSSPHLQGPPPLSLYLSNNLKWMIPILSDYLGHLSYASNNPGLFDTLSTPPTGWGTQVPNSPNIPSFLIPIHTLGLET